MALTRRRGSDSHIQLGRQTAYGTHIVAFPATPAANGASKVNEITGKRYPFTRLTLDATGEQTESESIIGGGSDTLNTLDTIGAEGELECEVLPEDIAHFLEMAMAPVRSSAGVPQKKEGTSALAAASSAVTDPTFATINNTKTALAWPSRITVASSLNKAVVVKGFRKTGRPTAQERYVEETIAAAATNRVGKYFYSSVMDVKHGNISSNGTFTADGTQATAGLGWDSDAFETKLQFGTEQHPGMTAQLVKGGIPASAFDIIANTTELRVGTGGIRILMSLLASKVLNYKMITSDITDKYEYDTSVANATLANYPLGNLKFFPRWGGALYFDQTVSLANAPSTAPTPFTDLTLTINHNYEADEAITGSRERGQPIVGGPGVRQITVSADVYVESGTAADNFVRWQDIYTDNKTARLELWMFNYLDNGRQYAMHVEAPVCQLTSMPTLTVEDRTQMSRRLEWKCVPLDTSKPDERELEITVYSQFNPFA